MANENVLTIEDVAEVLRVSPSTVRSMLKSGELQGFMARKQWRIRRDKLEEYMARQPEVVAA